MVTRSFCLPVYLSTCLRRRTPLIRVHTLPTDDPECDRLVPWFADIEKVVAEDMIDFERDIARAHRGTAPPDHLQLSSALRNFTKLSKLAYGSPLVMVNTASTDFF